tara:strand:- start:812 stop:1186 length:375 start_codon:yes stop_codon:yes gene_type:complete
MKRSYYLYLILGAIGVYGISTLLRRKKINEAIANISTDEEGNSGQAEAGFDANKVARALFLTMIGFGTDDAKFFEIGNSLSDSQMEAVKVAYANRFGESLEEAIKDDFSFGDEARALTLFGYSI